MSNEIKQPKSLFSCPLGKAVLWWHGLEYKECPLTSAYRDMPECKNCKLQIDKEFKGSKETWKEKPRKKKHKKDNKKYGSRVKRRGKK